MNAGEAFDYGFENKDGTITHANHHNQDPDKPATYYNRTRAGWQRRWAPDPANNPQGWKHHCELWCVACNNERY
jgi:hypothetical protein